MSPGFNFEGGVGRILSIHKIISGNDDQIEEEEENENQNGEEEYFLYDVKFMLDGHKEYKVEEEIISSSLLSSSFHQQSSSIKSNERRRQVKGRCRLR